LQHKQFESSEPVNTLVAIMREAMRDAWYELLIAAGEERSAINDPGARTYRNAAGDIFRPELSDKTQTAKHVWLYSSPSRNLGFIVTQSIACALRTSVPEVEMFLILAVCGAAWELGWVTALLWYIATFMGQKLNKNHSENRYFRKLLDEISAFGPNEPIIKIYLLDRGKQRFLYCVSPDCVTYREGVPVVVTFPPVQALVDGLRERYGSGKYLFRTVHPNGRFGPSRVVNIWNGSTKIR
jgi:predicted phage tail protein